jgi:hypothetical protein
MNPLVAALLTYAVCVGLLAVYTLTQLRRLITLSRRDTGKDKP